RALNNLEWNASWYKKGPFHDIDMYKNEPFELIIPAGAMNAKNVPLSIKMLNDNQYEVSASGETNQNGYLQTFKFEEVAEFGKPFLNDYFNFQLNKRNAQPEEKYVLNFN